MKKWLAAAALIATSTGAGLAQDVEKGANVFKQCQACHSIGPGAQKKNWSQSLMASTDERQVAFQTTAIPMQTKTPLLSGENRLSRNTQKIREPKSRAPNDLPRR